MLSTDQLQQHPVWFYDYENNGNLDSHYADHRQGPIGQPYAPVTCTNSAILSPSNVNSEPYAAEPIPDTSQTSARAFSTVSGPARVEQSRQYLISNAGSDSISANPNRLSSVNVSREITARPFPLPSSLSTAAEAIPSGGIAVSHPSSGSREIRNIPERPYHILTGAETTIAPPPLISDMPSTSAFHYSSSIPYTFTAPPPAPAASAVTSPPFTQVGDLPSFDLTAQMPSYPWSLSGDVFPSNILPITQTKSRPKAAKLKCVSGSGKKRVRCPEMWKKNLTKSKKLKGEEHVSRTGNLIPAKRVEEVDCSNCSFKCHESFSEDLRQQLFDVFYNLGSNESQKQFVCQNVQESATKVNGCNKKEGTTENKRKVCRKYFLPDTDNTRKQVCSKFFCATLAVGKTFITHALRNKQFGCYVGKEKRGKPHNKIPDMLLEPARQHINAMLAASSSGSKKNSKKKCLERGLNITKMHEMFKHECLEKGLSPISLSMYRRIFHTEF
ncbi:unnamed protein product [Candidula unifasciata]|uniref:Uncharacterized protein n=1 Tax=Candidula unifasciata TaxID=100452 RepID=A0A8S4A2D9_9EUPU|nr:unnamed protein product [Candidula unifasciata]